MKNVISTDKAPAAIGPYSQAIEVNGTVYTIRHYPGCSCYRRNSWKDLWHRRSQAFENLSNSA